ncbi:MAG: hypothetical protein FWG65_11565 [Turicibacter sp.]|nr:hypothetical protein [Turicibacter sp.]
MSLFTEGANLTNKDNPMLEIENELRKSLGESVDRKGGKSTIQSIDYINRIKQPKDKEQDDIAIKGFIDDWRCLISLVALNDTNEIGIGFEPAKSKFAKLIFEIEGYAKNTEAIDSDFKNLCGKAKHTIYYKDTAPHEVRIVLGYTNSYWIVAPNPDFSESIEKIRRNGVVIPDLKNDPLACRIVGGWVRAAIDREPGGILQSELNHFYNDLMKYYLTGIGKNFDSVEDQTLYITETKKVVSSNGELFKDEDSGSLSVAPLSHDETIETKISGISDTIWLKFFTGLALRDFGNYPVEYQTDEIIFFGKRIKGEEASNFTFYLPPYLGEDIRPKNDFQYICLWSWLDRFESKIPEQTNLREKVVRAKDTIETTIRKKNPNFRGVEMPDICFYSHGENDNPFYTTVHKQNAAFFFDEEGDLGKKVKLNWLNTLKAWALNDVRDFGLKFDLADESKVEPSTWTDSGFKIEGDPYKRHELKLGNEVIGITSRILLIETSDEGSKTLNEKGVSAVLSNLFRHEELIVAYWLGKLIENLDEGDAGKEYLKKIVKIIQDECDKLVGNENIEEWTKKGFFGKVYVAQDKIDANNASVLQLLPNFVEDNAFEKRLAILAVANDDDISPNELKESPKGAFSVYDVYSETDTGLNDPEMGGKERPKILLPFKDGLLNLLKNAYKEGDKSINNISTFGISKIQTIQQKDGKGYKIKITGDGKIIPNFLIEKLYSEDSYALVEGKIPMFAERVGCAAIWPSVDIEGFKAYKVNYVTDPGRSPSGTIGEISIPSIFSHRKDNGSPKDNEIRKYSQITCINEEAFDKVSYQLSEFPFALRFKFGKDLHSAKGIMLTTPLKRHTQTIEGQTLELSEETNKRTNVVIGIDFGTSNSLVYYKFEGHTEEILDWNDEYLNGIPVAGNRFDQLGKSALMFFQLPFASKSDSKKKKIFPTLFTRYKKMENKGNNPLLDGNITFLDDADMSETLGALLETRTLVHNAKWGADNNELPILLKQMLLSAYIVAVEKNNDARIKIEPRVSYPASLSNDLKDKFKLAWMNVVSYLKGSEESEGVFENADLIMSDPTFYTESLCVANSVNSNIYEAAYDLKEGGMVVDIGGGTTDIAIFKNLDDGTTTIKKEFSLPFGARKILGGALKPESVNFANELIKLRLKMLAAINTVSNGQSSDKETLFGSDASNGKTSNGVLRQSAHFIKEALKGERLDEFRFGLERAVEYYEEALVYTKEKAGDAMGLTLGDALDKVGFEESKEAKDRVSAILKVSCCALFYYLGTLEGSYNASASENEKVNVQMILLAGHGAGVLKDWMWDSDADDKLGKFYEAGRTFESRQNGQKPQNKPVKLRHSKKRKHEVAIGLVKAKSIGQALNEFKDPNNDGANGSNSEKSDDKMRLLLGDFDAGLLEEKHLQNDRKLIFKEGEGKFDDHFKTVKDKLPTDPEDIPLTQNELIIPAFVAHILEKEEF